MENKIYFEIEGIKFRYDTEDDYLARYFKKAYKNYRVVSTKRKNNKMYFYSKSKIYNFDSKTGDLYQHKKFILNIKQTSNPVPSSYPSKPTPCIDLGSGSLLL